MKKKDIYVIPHTHWDREWYFTTETSSILLNRLLYDLENKEFNKFTLDGQISLLDDMLQGNDNKKINKLIDEQKLIIGPLYVQQDTFNTMAATTQLNIDLSKKIINNRQKTKTMYMPDTFGFNEQLPQLFKLNGFDNFVFWRGLKKADIKKSVLFNWKGIDGTTLLSSCMSKGYYYLGQFYPYNEKEQNKNFEKNLIEYVKYLEENKELNSYFVPLGGDQAPLEFNIGKILEKLNKEQNEYNFKIGAYDDYFKNLKLNKNKPDEINYPLYNSGFSKIHRTIHSNRYNTKKLFRDCELAIYHIMQPLEIMYKSYNGKLLSESYKEENIYKPLLKSSAHDSLGGCNSDETNSIIIARLKSVKSTIESYIDLMLKDINTNLKLENKYVAYNLASYKRNLFIKDIISTSTNKNLSYEQKDVAFLDYYIEDVTWKGFHDPVFNHHIVLELKNMEPFSYKVIDLLENSSINLVHNIKLDNLITIKNNNLLFNINNKKIEFSLQIEEDEGDEYDYSTPKNMKVSKVINSKLIEQKNLINIAYKKIFSTILYANKKYEFFINCFLYDNKINFDIEFINEIKNARIILKTKKQNLTLSRHLAFIDQKIENNENWKELNHKDKPVNSYANDGLIIFKDSKLNLMTKGTNEVSIRNDYVAIVLARFVSYLGKPNLNDRPGPAGGVPLKVPALDSLLHKHKLKFNFEINADNAITALNNWNFIPIGKQIDVINPIIKRIDKFIINDFKLDLNKKINFKNLDVNKLLISIYKLEDNKIKILASNPINKDNSILKAYKIKFFN